MKKRNASNSDKNSAKKTKHHHDGKSIVFNQFMEKIPHEILVHILQFVPYLTRVHDLVYVSKMFHEILYDPNNNCFEDVTVKYPFKNPVPNLSLVRRLKFEKEFVPCDDDEDEEKHEENWKKLDRVQRLTIPLHDDYYFLPTIEKYFKNIEYLFYGFVFSDQVWQVVKKMKNLKVLRVYDFAEDLDCACKDDLALTDLEVIESFSYATYGYSENGPINIYNSLENILSCSPNFGNIYFQPDAFCVNITQLYKIVTEYSKQLKSVVLSVNEDTEEEYESEQYIVQKVNFDCSFLQVKASTTMSVVLKYFFPNCKISSKLENSLGNKITTSLLKNRRILKNSSDLNILDELLTKSTSHSGSSNKQDDNEDDEEVIEPVKGDYSSDESEEDEEEEEEIEEEEM